MAQIWKSIRKQLNFYRVHILVFIFTPLIFSAIFYASNGRNHISYIDSLFLCVSAMAVCGLATVDLSLLTDWQQAMLFILMCMGNPVVVSWVMVYIRKYYFAKKFEHIITVKADRQAADLALAEADAQSRPWSSRVTSVFRKNRDLSTVAEDAQESKEHDHGSKQSNIARKLRTDMIRRVDDAPKLINPSGWISEGDTVQLKKVPAIQPEPGRQLAFTLSAPPKTADRDHPAASVRRRRFSRRLSDPGASSRPPSPINFPMQRFETMAIANAAPGSPTNNAFPRTQTIEFAPSVIRRRERGRSDRLFPHSHEWGSASGHNIDLPFSEDRRSTYRGSIMPGVPLTIHGTTHTHRTALPAKHRDFGGFPMPWAIIRKIFRRFFPKFHRQLTRTVTVPLTTTITTHRGGKLDGAKPVSYISFDAVVGRNSAFHTLTSEQLEELGGVEYRALNALLWIVAGYHIGIQLLAFVIIAPYISASRWHDAFVYPQLHKNLAPPWFALFQVVSAYTNTGMSLVDQSMVPFQRAYPMIVVMLILILAGNTCFPIFLRFTIWSLSKVVPSHSRMSETLQFLLDHPRRCFIYLFPSHQTWFLVTVVLTLSLTDWFFFLVLDIGNASSDSLPLGTRLLAGLLQALAVRAAGFGIVVLSALAPAVKFLYVIMMYISVYPIAMSVRSTNVYEQQSLGIFEEEDESDEEQDFQVEGPRVTVWSRYLAMHVRRQLAFDMWWLGLAIFLVCIIERGHLDDEANFGWFNIFSVVFELVSAYGTVGLSLGLPLGNYSFSGAFRPLSKLIVCFVMIRGRHRGLPVAIDRAVMLPNEFENPAERQYLDEVEQTIDPQVPQHTTNTAQILDQSENPQIHASPRSLHAPMAQVGEIDNESDSTRRSMCQETGGNDLLAKTEHETSAMHDTFQ